MKETLQHAFDPICADDAMKNAARAAVAHRRAAAAPKQRFRARPAAAVLCALVLLFGMGGYTVYATPVSYIDIDVNPSLELALNRFDRVVDATPLNEDGAALLEEVELRHLSYTSAIDRVVASAPVQQCLADGKELTFTVASEREAELMQGIAACRGGKRGTCQGATEEMRAAAQSSGIPLGKYSLYQAILALDPQFTPEECSRMTMQQLRTRYRQLSGTDFAAKGSEMRGK